jgi:trimethylamine--corrinoid protein Co-methyltransferase
MLSDWRNNASWAEAGARTAGERATGLWQQALADYEEPSIDPGIREALEDYVARRKIEIGDGDP